MRAKRRYPDGCRRHRGGAIATIAQPTPPRATRVEHVHELHGDRRPDPYHWLKDPTRTNSDVLAHLEAENAYADAMLGHTSDLQEQLVGEMLACVPERDETVPIRDGVFLYYAKTTRDAQHWDHYRRRGDDGDEELVLDVNQLAARHDYFRLGALQHSPDHRLLAYSTDLDGSERFTLVIKDLVTGEPLEDRLEGTSYGVVWGPGSDELYYATVDEKMRPDKVWRHRLGTSQADDQLVFHETDDMFYVHFGQSRTRRFLIVATSTLVTAECHVLDLTEPTASLRVVEPRRHGHDYDVDDLGDGFIVRSNDEAEDFRVFEAPHDDPGRARWREIVPQRAGVAIKYVMPFRAHLVLAERSDGLTRLRVIDRASGDDHLIAFDEPVHLVWPVDHEEFDTSIVRFVYESMGTPESTFDYDMTSRERTLRKQDEVPGYDPHAYRTERVWATAPDGTRVPISLVRHRDASGPGPCWLYGYGSYGSSSDPTFNSARVSLLKRGFSIAIAHIRGGGDLGEAWRNDGKLARKMNTFTDFVACAEQLVADGVTTPEQLVANGASAGGLLMGAITNLRPDLFAAIIADVPFVDVLSTVLDTSLLFSALERDEWGDATIAEHYAWIRAYSPYDNVTAQAYPAVLATTGLHDPRVNYWEPAKWVARLRDETTSNRPVLLRTYLNEGHAGASGRQNRLRQVAFKYAFAFEQLGLS